MHMIFLLWTFTMVMASCQNATQQQTNIKNSPASLAMSGDTVSQLGDNIMIIFQDRNHIYWFGSWKNGLYRYDGSTMIHYTTQHGLPSDRIEEIKEDKFGQIYINTGKGLCRYHSVQFVKIEENPISMASWKLDTADLWFKSSKPGHVYRYDGKNLYSLALPKTSLAEVYDSVHLNATNPSDVYCIYRDSKGAIWFGTAAMGALRYDGRSFDWIQEPDVTELHNGPSNGVRSITEDRDGYFWFNTNYKYQIYSKSIPTKLESEEKRFYKRIPNIGSLDGMITGDLNEYLSIIKDEEDHLWIALYLGGVWKYDGRKIHHYPIRIDGKDIPIFYLYKDHYNKIWLGTHENGAFIFNGSGFEPFEF